MQDSINKLTVLRRKGIEMYPVCILYTDRAGKDTNISIWRCLFLDKVGITHAL